MKESPQVKAFKEILPDDLKNIAQVSFSHRKFWGIVHGHLKTLYADRADWAENLKLYFRSSEYRKVCHNGKCIGDITLLNINDIKQMIFADEQYSLRANELVKCFREQMSTPSATEERKYVFNLASMLGLLPEANENSLFAWLIRKTNVLSNEQKKLNELIAKNTNLLSVLVGILTKMFIPGFTLKYPNVGCVMTQQRGKFYYRGENAYYKTSKASVYRGASNLPSHIKTIVDHLRLCECWNLLDQFDSVKHWQYSEINYIALAQHYGLRTQMIDITSDLKTALFFACCKFGDNRRWHPLASTDIEHVNSRKEIARLGGDSRFGIIYRTPTEITDMKWTLSEESTGFQIITPVGYQPFMRCSSQYSYMMLTHEKYDLLRDSLFNKYKIRLSEDLCKWIYEEMDCGNAIYPHDDIPDISKEIEAINTQQVFSETVFQAAMKTPNITKEYLNRVRQELQHYGFSIRGKVKLINEKRLNQINAQYSAVVAMEKAEIPPQVSPLITIS